MGTVGCRLQNLPAGRRKRPDACVPVSGNFPAACRDVQRNVGVSRLRKRRRRDRENDVKYLFNFCRSGEGE
jgi:hypothetical protein